jgi:hypothetical protein
MQLQYGPENNLGNTAGLKEIQVKQAQEEKLQRSWQMARVALDC